MFARVSVPLAAGAPAAPITSASRVASIDLIRGAVMILMAIDHVRVYSGLPAGGPTAGIFFTRWVTHFVAPAFIFLAGTSAYFYGRKHSDLPRFLCVRGIWLVLLEQHQPDAPDAQEARQVDRKSTRLNSSHGYISYAVFCF